MRGLLRGLLVAAVGVGLTLEAIAGKEVSYQVNGSTFTGYIARPADATTNLGGVLVVHEWWGHDDYVRRRADMLAELGYVAMAVDMYGDGKVADHPEDAGKFMNEVLSNMAAGEKRFRAALDLLMRQPGVVDRRIGAIGYCFGGAMVLEMARRGVPLASVASFHGSLGGLSPIGPDGVKARVLVLNGADDPFIKAEQISKFKQDMDAAGADYRFINYPGAVHSFTNPAATERGKKFNLPLAYNADVDAKSWAEMKALFDATLK